MRALVRLAARQPAQPPTDPHVTHPLAWPHCSTNCTMHASRTLAWLYPGQLGALDTHTNLIWAGALPLLLPGTFLDAPGLGWTGYVPRGGGLTLPRASDTSVDLAGKIRPLAVTCTSPALVTDRLEHGLASTCWLPRRAPRVVNANPLSCPKLTLVVVFLFRTYRPRGCWTRHAPPPSPHGPHPNCRPSGRLAGQDSVLLLCLAKQSTASATTGQRWRRAGKSRAPLRAGESRPQVSCLPSGRRLIFLP